jgi:hypothetical protein
LYGTSRVVSLNVAMMESAFVLFACRVWGGSVSPIMLYYVLMSWRASNGVHPGPCLDRDRDAKKRDTRCRPFAVLVPLTQRVLPQIFLCCAGNPDGTWTVDLPAAEVPPEMPEPVLGINFARNGMAMNDWLSLCAIHSDSWLMSLLFFFGARFNCTGRAELFALANQHPTIYEVVTDKVPRNVMYKRQDGGETYLPADDAGRRVTEPAIRSEPSGKIIGPSEFSTALCGKRAELFWPDDRKWYLVEIQAIDMDSKMAKVRPLAVSLFCCCGESCFLAVMAAPHPASHSVSPLVCRFDTRPRKKRS